MHTQAHEDLPHLWYRRGVEVIESKPKFDIRAALKGMKKNPITVRL